MCGIRWHQVKEVYNNEKAVYAPQDQGELCNPIAYGLNILKNLAWPGSSPMRKTLTRTKILPVEIQVVNRPTFPKRCLWDSSRLWQPESSWVIHVKTLLLTGPHIVTGDGVHTLAQKVTELRSDVFQNDITLSHMAHEIQKWMAVYFLVTHNNWPPSPSTFESPECLKRRRCDDQLAGPTEGYDWKRDVQYKDEPHNLGMQSHESLPRALGWCYWITFLLIFSFEDEVKCWRKTYWFLMSLLYIIICSQSTWNTPLSINVYTWVFATLCIINIIIVYFHVQFNYSFQIL